MDTKLIKDPVHGYIRIPKDYAKYVIDSCEFQRLRNIRQTSYDSLYPGSSHNRFIHSLGVYHLGHEAFKSLKRNSDQVIKLVEDDWLQFESTFELACLLHDVGHMPFSHDGENFLLIEEESDEYAIMKTKIGKNAKDTSIKALYNSLLRIMEEVLDDEKIFQDFVEDFAYTIVGSKNSDGKKSTAKPHEIMSVIVSMNVYKDFMLSKNVNLDLFARAILGIVYKEKDTDVLHNVINNALIQILNSSIIDVDRLDYIIRDTQMSGIDSVAIDLERLLESAIIVQGKDKKYYFAYKKNALSIIENVVLAHDVERRWLQPHPVVIYDSFLIKKCLEDINKTFKIKNSDQGIFQRRSLSLEGVLLENGLNIRLLSDGDCLFLIKQLKEMESKFYVTEYLMRSKRKQPIWKSEAEFILVLGQLNETQKNNFLTLFGAESEEKGSSSIGDILNHKRIEQLRDDINSREKDTQLSDEDRIYSTIKLKKQLFWLEKLEQYFQEKGMEFEIYNQIQDKFQSKINQLSTKGICIWFDSLKEVREISKVFKVYNVKDLNENEPNQNKLIYWYIHKTEKFSVGDFADFMKVTADDYEKQNWC